MKNKFKMVGMLLMVIIFNISAQNTTKLPVSKVDFDAFEKLTQEVKMYRKDRLVSLDDFIKKSKEANTIILDSRSTEMYNRKHVKGAVHLDFTDFTQANLAKVITSTTTNILIYCNNNFANDEINFQTKMYIPKKPSIEKPITLALNIPTFINLYGYGYKNVYELADLVSVFNSKIEFEGSDIMK
jgi:hypothetical protein